MSEISELLQEGIRRKGWPSIAEAARRIDVERTFLSRLLKGDPPRRVRGGSRAKVQPDERYHKMASALDLGDEFLELVARELEARSPRQPKSTEASSHKTERTEAHALAVESLGEGYPELWKIAESHGDLRSESALLRLAEDFLGRSRSDDLWARRIRSDRRVEHFFEPKRHNRLGKLPGSSTRPNPVESITCRRIAESITDRIRQSGDDPSRQDRIEIASFFFEMAYCLFD